MFAVRQTEEWTAGSITAGILLGIVTVVALAIVIERASRR